MTEKQCTAYGEISSFLPGTFKLLSKKPRTM